MTCLDFHIICIEFHLFTICVAMFLVLYICDVFLDPWQLMLKFFKRDLHFGVFSHECMVKSMPGLSGEKLTVNRNVQLYII